MMEYIYLVINDGIHLPGNNRRNWTMVASK
ncbi:Uncharacterised protein [Streptococcus pneumoniae]|nr:Uncharacterised protein [Streptococcus pneumoniae]VPD99105.1 Uncharacterised protein [Streptococcus pneumoniae]